MLKATKLAVALLLLAGAGARAVEVSPRAEVVHWWTSGSESAAIKVIAERYRAAGGIWIDSAVAGSEQARAVAINRIISGNAPAAAQFNTSKQFLDLIEEDMLSNVDALARQEQWDTLLPESIRNVIRVDGHYYALPIGLHLTTWLWYSKAAFRKAGIHKEPASMDELFGALDRLKAAGLVPLAHGSQSWQDNVVFMTVLLNVGGKDLYNRFYRDHEQGAVWSDGFRKSLLAFRRLYGYLDAGAPGRTWNEATSLMLQGRAGVQIMGDWVKGEIRAAGLTPGKEIGCIAGFGAAKPMIVLGDAFIFPKSERHDVQRAQQLLGKVMVAAETQIRFSQLKGSIPLRHDLDPQEVARLDVCTQTALAVLKDKARHVGSGEIYFTSGQNNAMGDVLSAFWTTAMPVEKAQQGIAAAMRR